MDIPGFATDQRFPPVLLPGSRTARIDQSGNPGSTNGINSIR
jgi:hypothetical protein